MIDTRSAFHRWVLLPVALLLRGELAAYGELSRLRALQYDPAGLGRLRERRLQGILDHAITTVPHYRNLLSPGTVELDRFPILEKEDLVTHAEELRSTASKRAAVKTTGGSTGRAVTVRKNPRAIASERAATWMAYEWYGLRPGDPVMRFWGSGGGRKRRLRALLSDAAMNRQTASAFAFGDSDLAEYWRRIQADDPVSLYGYVSMLEVMARFGLEHGLSPTGDSLRAVITTAESLLPYHRKLMKRAFGVPVWDEYGCGEVGPIAYECPSGNLHLMEAHLWFEVIDDSGEVVGEEGTGELIITDLTNTAMPLIRYRVGDTVTLGRKCGCGRSFTTIEKVEGRSYDLIEDSLGRKYHGEAVMYVFEDLRDKGLDVSRFQVLQAQPGKARVLFVTEDSAEGVGNAIVSLFSERLGGLEVEPVRVDRIERAPSGKMRLIIRE